MACLWLFNLSIGILAQSSLFHSPSGERPEKWIFISGVSTIIIKEIILFTIYT